MGTALLGLSAAVFGAGLGEARLQSSLGQPLRLEVALLGEDAASLGEECFRLVVPAGGNGGDDIPAIRDAQLKVATPGGNPVLRIGTRYPVPHPVFTVGLEVVCNAQVRRTYTLLAAPDTGSRSEPTQARETPPAAQAPSASAPHVAPRAARPQSTTKPAAALPNTDAAVATPHPAREARPARKSAAAPTASRDRLVIDAGGTNEPALRNSVELGNAETGNVTAAQREQLRREQELVLTLDDRIASLVELQDRLQKLEAAQTRLQEENRRLQAALQAQVQTPPPAASPSSWRLPDWRWLLGGLFALLLLFLLLRRRQGRAAEPAAEAPVVVEALPAASDFEVEPLTAEDIWPEEEQGPPSVRLPLRHSTAQAAGDWAPATIAPSSLGPSSLMAIDDTVEEHDSAVELAEIMMSFGRVQGAAETLAEFIRANPKGAVKPWVKLLEVYRAANMRTEFDALAHQLNKTFNVKAVQWIDFDEVKHASETVEQLQHIVNQLLALWGTRACQTYLHHLLRDNRKGTRQGFPLGIVDDLLMLSGVLEIQLGQYKPTAEEIAALEAEAPPPPPAAQDMMADLVPDIPAPSAGHATRSALDFELAPPELPPSPAAAPFDHSAIEFNLDDDLSLPESRSKYD
ncbi:hypothetical protein [Niveibacterium sp. SC-1]|uniref:type IV pilus assembly protein FimV n=1 Tax=Niveibacterium sp. SC-1 TaxID=3135646 RepID=UPI00311EBD85